MTVGRGPHPRFTMFACVIINFMEPECGARHPVVDVVIAASLRRRYTLKVALRKHGNLLELVKNEMVLLRKSQNFRV